MQHIAVTAAPNTLVLLLPPLLLLATALPTLQVSRSSVQRRVPMRLQVRSNLGF